MDRFDVCRRRRSTEALALVLFFIDLDTEDRGAINSANVMDIDAADDLRIGVLDVRSWPEATNSH
jgi:hypothetical protein